MRGESTSTLVSQDDVESEGYGKATPLLMPGASTHLDDESEHAVTTGKLRRTLHYRLIIFFIIEAAFIALASISLNKPLIITPPHTFPESEIKGGFTILAILWQTLAFAAAEPILFDAFSREWSAHLEKRNPAAADRVSTITSSHMDRIPHFFTRIATMTFRLAYAASFALLVLGKLAPGTVNVISTLVPVPMVLEVANFTDADQQMISDGKKANLIASLEQFERSKFGLNVQPNWIIPWPIVNLTDFNGTMEYNSDVVEFHHDCHWEAPTFVGSNGDSRHVMDGRTPVRQNMTVQVAGGEWVASSLHQIEASDPRGLNRSAVIPLLHASGSTPNISTILFFGQNATITAGVDYSINLGALPATVVNTSFVGTQFPGDKSKQLWVNPLASVLVCDLHSQLSGGRVRLSTDGSLSVLSSGQQTIGNVPSNAVNFMFSDGLRALTSLNSLDGCGSSVGQWGQVSDMSRFLFLEFFTDHTGSYPTLKLETINSNLDKVMVSVSKAYCSGREADDIIQFGGVLDIDLTNATSHEYRLALVTTKSFFVGTVVCVGLSLLLLFSVCRSTLGHDERQLFTLRNVKAMLQDEKLS